MIFYKMTQDIYHDPKIHAACLCLDGIAAEREELGHLCLALGLLLCLVLGEPAADGTSLLGAKVKGGILGVFVMLAQSTLLCLVDDGQHTSNVLAHYLDLGELGCRSASHLGDA